MVDFLFLYLVLITNPLVICILSFVAAISFLTNTTMRKFVRMPMAIILSYFALVYLSIFLADNLVNNLIVVRIGLVFLLSNIASDNLLWTYYFKKRIEQFTPHNRRAGDK